MADRQERTPVVTSFLYKKDKVALIKRSQQVGTYRGAWAAFSGYVERAPLAQARLELQEEARIAPEQANLRGIGIPLPIDDDITGAKWLVFPFLFELADDVEIITDWESEKWDWFTPRDIHDSQTVPGLVQTLNRVWPAFGTQKFWQAMEGIGTNLKDGATELARRGLFNLGEYVQSRWTEMDRNELNRVIRAFAAVRPVMGVFPDLAARLMLAIEREGGQFDMDELITELLSAVDDATSLSSSLAAERLSGAVKIFTLSYSQAVYKTILAWHNEEREVVVAESNPGKEGIDLAEDLMLNGVNARIVDDTEIERVIRQVDAVLVGCDMITESNELLNKIGTCRAVLAAVDADVPSYAVAQTFKIAPPGWPVFLEPRERIMMESGAVSGGKAVFDLTPLTAFKSVYTEEGVLDNARLAQLKEELGLVELIP